MADIDHLRKTLEYYMQQRQQKLDELRPIDLMIRQLRADLGEAQPESQITDDQIALPLPARSGLHPLSFLRPDEFFGMSQSDAAKAYLEKVGHAITLDELLEALQKGGANVGGVEPRKTLYVSLARNPRKEFVWPSKDHVG